MADSSPKIIYIPDEEIMKKLMKLCVKATSLNDVLEKFDWVERPLEEE